MSGNKFMVGIQGEIISILKPVPQRMSKEDALGLAANLVSLACDDYEQEFIPILVQILSGE